MLLDSYFPFLASQCVVQHIKHVSSSEDVWWTRKIRNTTGMLGCVKGSKFGHFHSSCSSDTCRNLGNNEVYVHCALIKLPRWVDKVLLLLIPPCTPYVPWDKLLLSRIWVQPLDSRCCMPVPGGKTRFSARVLVVGIPTECWLCSGLT